jgi:DNA-binding CsgD family transcriptional regulator
MNERMLNCIYAAAVEEAALHELLGWITKVTGSRGAGIYRLSSGQIVWQRSTGMPEDFLAEFATDYAPFDPRFEYISRFPVGVAHSDADPEIRRAMQAGPVAEFVEGNDLHYTAGTLLCLEKVSLTTVYLSRSIDQGQPGELAFDVLEKIAPHLARSMQIRQWHQAMQSAAAASIERTNPSLLQGKILFDLGGRIAYMDAVAESALEISQLGRVWAGRLTWRKAHIQDWMEQTLRLAASRPRTDWPQQELRYQDHRGAMHLAIAAAQPLPEFEGPLLESLHSRLLLAVRWCPTDATAQVRLTPRQQEVLAALERGLNSSEIAGELGCSKNTVRVHVQAMLDKFGASSRLEMLHQARSSGLI